MFFQTMFRLMSPGVDYNLTLSRTEGKLTVLVMPKVGGLKDAAQHNLVPFTLCAPPEEIDRGFFPALQQPLLRTAALLTNMAEYEKQADKAAAGSKVAKAEKSKADDAAREKKEKYDGFMKKVGELEAAGDIDGALLQLQQARLHATDKTTKTVDEKIAALRAKNSQGSLFGEPTPTPATPQSVPAVTAEPQQMAPQPAAVSAQPELAASPTDPVATQPAAIPAQQDVQPVQPQGAAPQPQMPPPMQGQPTPAPAAPQGYSGYPVYPPMPQGGQPGYGAGMFGMAPANGQGYPQQPHSHGVPHGSGAYGGMTPNPGFMPAGEVYNPGDYADIPDVHVTHVGQAMNQPL